MTDPTDAPTWADAPTESFAAVFDAPTEAIEVFAGSDHDTIYLDDDSTIAGSLFLPTSIVLQTWRDERLLAPEL